MTLKIRTLLLLALAVMLFSSCENKDIQSSEIIYSMLRTAPLHFSGTVYKTKSSEGSVDHLSPVLLSELYGSDFDFSDIDGAVYLSGGMSLFELAFFSCPTPQTAEALAGICAVRFENSVNTAKRIGISETERTVKIYGNYVIAAMCDGSERVACAGVEKIKAGNLRFVKEIG